MVAPMPPAARRAPAQNHAWGFRSRFRRGAFGWRSQPAIARIGEAVAEIKRVARTDPVIAADGAVLFLEKLSPAIEAVDSSSGSIGTAVNKAIVALTGIIASAPADLRTRSGWLDRLWGAYLADHMGYLDQLGDQWGDLCASPELASEWADRLLGSCRAAWSPGDRTYFKGTVNCLGSLLVAGRYEELLHLLELDRHPMWHYRRYGVAGLVALGRPAEAIRYAEQSRSINDNPVQIARACEEILLSSGLADEAYQRYGILASQAGTYVAWFRAVQRKYPARSAGEILSDLVAATPGQEGKWFAAAKDAGLYAQAIALARTSGCAPQTLARAARDFMDSNPPFGMEAGLAALHWFSKGYGYEVTGHEILDVYSNTIHAAQNAGCSGEAAVRIRSLVEDEASPASLVARVLGARLGR